MKELNAKAAEMFAVGESVNAVAMKLFNKNYAKAKKQHGLWVEQSASAAETEADAEPDGEGPESWALSLASTVTTEQLVPMFQTFTGAEQAGAVQWCCSCGWTRRWRLRATDSARTANGELERKRA